MAWLRLASHLHISLQRCKAETTSTELPLWMAYLDRVERQKLDRREKWEYYLAQIACEIRRVLAKKPKKIKAKHFLLSFEIKHPSSKKRRPEIADAKSFFLGSFGIKY